MPAPYKTGDLCIVCAFSSTLALEFCQTRQILTLTHLNFQRQLLCVSGCFSVSCNYFSICFTQLNFVKKAEGEGFKPPIPERGIPDFESSAIDHSANLPYRKSKKTPFLMLKCTFHAHFPQTGAVLRSKGIQIISYPQTFCGK